MRLLIDFFSELARRDPVLWVTGWVELGLGAAFVVGLVVDDRLILGVNPWLKPLKFALSITIYVWTIAWLLGEVSAAAPQLARVISIGTAVAMLTEIACIALQSLRGTTSHFNDATPFDGALFGLMGFMILFSSVLGGVLLVLYFTSAPGLPASSLWGVRLGLILFLLGSAVGPLMVSRHAHAVGVPDGGPGLPFVNWSTEGGDLRIAHAVGLHALQILPLSAWLLGVATPLGPSRRTLVVFALAALLLLVGGCALVQALQGRPLVSHGPGGRSPARNA
jgi:hypothetical protein